MKLPRVLWLNCDVERAFEGSLDEDAAPSTRRRQQIEACARVIAGFFARREHRVCLLHPAMSLDQRRLSLAAMDAHAPSEAWCPTQHAQRALRELGLSLDAVPPPDAVLKRVNHRGFCSALAARSDPEHDLPGARFCTTIEDVVETLATAPTRTWLLKRPFGFSGRARKIVSGLGGLCGPTRTWAEASMESYGIGLQVEPRVEIVRELAVHTEVDREGHCSPLRLRELRTDERGAWRDSPRLAWSTLSKPRRDALERTAHACAIALHEEQYFGPMGIDAFVWRDEHGIERLRTCSEINARFGMSWWQ